MKSSSVYRMIHETDKRHPGAFEGRPYKIPALEDYKQLLQACTCQVKELYNYYTSPVTIIKMVNLSELSFQNGEN